MWRASTAGTSLTLAQSEVPVPVALRLFLPEDWVADPERCERAGVPEAAVVPQSKGEIALRELDRLRAEGVRFGVVLVDAGYGCSAVFRHGLDARGLAWAAGVARNEKVYDPDVRLEEPGGRANPCRIRSRGTPRRFWPRCLGGA